MAILEVAQLEKSFGGTKVLRDISFSLEEGQALSIIGSSGSGKTTLLRCLNFLETPDSGRIAVRGRNLLDGSLSPQERRRNRLHFGLVFQDFNQLLPWKTVKKNIQYPLKINGIKDKDELERIAQEHLDMVGLGDKGDLYPHQLSGGMKQRVAIAKGLALNPKIILMDEPFASLDAMTRNKLQAELLRIKEQQDATVIFITHNIQEALVLGNRIILMSKKGEIKIDTENNIPKPVTPASEGYGQMWKMFNDALWEENDDEE